VEKVTALAVALSTLIYGGARIWMAWDLTRRAIEQGRNLTITQTPGITRIRLQSNSVPKAEPGLLVEELKDPPAPSAQRLPWRGKRKGGGR
jgi:hypothetical protein